MQAFLITIIVGILIGSTGAASALEVSVKDYGAKGDGKTDDRMAIQSAIDTVNKAGGGIVNFPEGTYLVTAPNKAAWAPQIKLCNHLKLRGEGMTRSVVKVADNQLAYDTILAGDAIEGFSMLDLGIDGNGATNPVITKDDAVASPYQHTLVNLPKSKDVIIQRCRFTNLSGVWAVNAYERAENFVIDSCLFDNIGGYTKNDWDHSCIRIDGYGPCVVSNNVMTSRFGAGTTGARTAVEIHGGNHKFINNLITGFRYGVNVCSGGDGKKDEPSVHQYYLENKMVNVGCGFAIWGIENSWYDNLVFERNDITIDVTGWKSVYPEFYGIGIVAYKGTPPPNKMENVRITDNHITYINSEGGVPRSAGMRFDFATYSDHWSEKPSGEMTNVRILRNTISGAFSSGIEMNCTLKDAQISENTIIDSAVGVVEKELKAAITLRGSTQNLTLMNNQFYTTKATPLSTGIYDTASHISGFSQTGNRVSGAGAINIPVYFALQKLKNSNPK